MPRTDTQDLKYQSPPNRITLWPWLLIGGTLFAIATCLVCAAGAFFYYQPRNPSPEYLVGTWRHKSPFMLDIVYEFRDDGTGSMSHGGLATEFVYQLDGFRVTLEHPEVDRHKLNFGKALLPAHKRVWRSGSDLLVESEDQLGEALVFKRVP